MAEEQRPEQHGPADEGNGGPVKPGAETRVGPSGPGADGNGAPGVGAAGDTVRAKPVDSDTVPEPDAGKLAPSVLKRSRVSGVWVGLVLSAVVLLFLLIFILQNLESIQIQFLGAQSTLPAGVALLFAAVLGILLVAIPGFLRILQLRRAMKKRGRH